MKTGERRKGPACSCSRRAGQRQDRLGLDHGATWHFTHCEAAAANAPALSSSSSCLVSTHRLSLPGKQKVPGLSEAAGGHCSALLEGPVEPAILPACGD